MSLYISPNNEYPRHIGDVQLASPNWKPDDELPSGWIAVVPTDPPIAEQGKVVYESAPVETDGVWLQTWAIRDLTDAEIQQRNLAEIRRKVLANEPLTEAEALLLVG
jgi:hypothetical protein